MYVEYTIFFYHALILHHLSSHLSKTNGINKLHASVEVCSSFSFSFYISKKIFHDSIRDYSKYLDAIFWIDQDYIIIVKQALVSSIAMLPWREYTMQLLTMVVMRLYQS